MIVVMIWRLQNILRLHQGQVRLVLGEQILSELLWTAEKKILIIFKGLRCYEVYVCGESSMCVHLESSESPERI